MLKQPHVIQRSDTLRNKLLSSLPERDIKRLLPILERVELHHNQILFEGNSPILHAWFPDEGLVALMAIVDGTATVEIGFAGSRGMLGLDAALGFKTHMHTCIVQVGGNALRMPANAFVTAFQRGGAFQVALLEYARHGLLTISQYAVCNYFHSLRQRFALLLLTVHDEVQSAEFPMTQQFISGMLGTARSEVAKLAGAFRKAGIIDYHRTLIKVTNRRKLERAACECYGVLTASDTSRRAKTR
jgi:CRP-like cAMP-binding protein